MSKNDTHVVNFDITWQTLLKLVAMAVAVWAAFSLRDIIFMIFVVFIFVAAVNPTVKTLQKYMSRGIAVALFYVLLLVIAVLLSYLFVPTLLNQVNQLSHIIPDLLKQVKPLVESLQSDKYTNLLNSSIEHLSGGVQNLGGDFYTTLLQVFGGIATFVSGLVLSFYLLLEENNAREFFHQILPADRYQAVYNTIRKISIQLGAWIRGQLTIMLAVAILNALAYAIIGIPSPLALGIWSGLGEAIPYIGPVLGVFPGVILALTTGSILKVILVLAINYFVIQQLQNFYITPRVMSRVIGLSPVLVILAILVGISLFGLVGAIIALPVAAIISVVVGDWSNLRKLWGQTDQSQEK
jgi:predicted PurR-regulated permease PerM